MTKSYAIRVATDRCSAVYRVAYGKYTFDILHPKTFEWVRQPIRDYNSSNYFRTEFIVNDSRAMLGRPPIEYKRKEGVRFDAFI
jgi:hypothetical protein